MACYHPIDAWIVSIHPNSGKKKLSFRCLGIPRAPDLQVPCGQCKGCRLERSRQWAIRCLHEASLYTVESGGRGNCFLTLTYDDDHLPFSVNESNGEMLPTLVKRDFQLFMKRLRKRFGDGIRFFHCGEYGEKLGRPHYHAILFNFDFEDKVFFKSQNGFPVYVSKSLSELWPHGMHGIGNVTFESAAYVARYIMKKVTGDLADDYYNGRLPDYTSMSLKPGIAKGWFDKYSKSVFPHDYVVLRNMKLRPPKYYDKLFDLQDSDEMCRIKEKRKELASSSPDNTPERLLVREAVLDARLNKLVRPIE